MLTISDVSSHQRIAMMTKAVKETDGVMIKATEGTTYVNPYWKLSVTTAKRYGKLYGFYHFARPDKSGWKAEADAFIKIVRPYIGDAVLALDWEGKALGYSAKWARSWLDYVYKQTGVKPMIYMSESSVVRVGRDVVSGDYGLWVAKYSKKEPAIAPWDIKAMWQYTDSPYDKSKFYGTRKTWQAYARAKR